MKGSCLIVAVVLVIYGILEVMRRKVGIKRFALLVLTALPLLWRQCGRMELVRTACKLDRYEPGGGADFPMAHWVMMSMSGTGGYNRTDFDYTYSYPTKEEKSQADWERAREKIEGYGGLAGFLNFEFQKIAATWGDGKYTQQIHLTLESETDRDSGFHQDGWEVLWNLLQLHDGVCAHHVPVFPAVHWEGDPGQKQSPNPDPSLYLRALLFFAFWETKSRYLLNLHARVFPVRALWAGGQPAPAKGRHRMSGEHSNGKSPKLRSNKD